MMLKSLNIPSFSAKLDASQSALIQIVAQSYSGQRCLQQPNYKAVYPPAAILGALPQTSSTGRLPPDPDR